MRALDYLTAVLLLAFALLASPGSGEGERGAPGAVPPAETRARPLFERVELDGPTLARHQRLFAYHDVLAAPAFRVDGAGSTPLTIFFMRLPEVARGAFTTPAIAAVELGTQKHWELELTAYHEGNLVAIEDFDVRDTDGDGRPEILFVALFETVDRGRVREFRRGFQVVRGDDGQLVKTLGSWEVREDASIATVGGLVAALDALRAEKHCPELSKDMDDTTTVAAVRCMVDNDRRAQLAASVVYPLQVLLPSGVVRMLKRPAELFGILEMHGTCGNDNYTFFGPDGDVGYHHVSCYGPGPEPEYSVTGGRGDGPCLNHRMLR